MHLFNWATILADTGKVHAFPKANPNSRAVKLSSDSKVVGLHPMTLTFSCCGVWRGGNPNGVELITWRFPICEWRILDINLSNNKLGPINIFK